LWPNITILNPRQNEKDFASNVFPANLGSLNETINNAMRASTAGGADELLALTIDLGRDVENLKSAEVSLAQNVFAQISCIRFSRL
jgi:hypothetical protein